MKCLKEPRQRQHLPATLAALLAAACVLPANAADTIEWFTVDAGGIQYALGGGFELAATLGQPDALSPAAPLTGGGFELVGGLWPVAPAFPGDLDEDGDVDINDLAALLANYGCFTPPCSGDINGDGQTDVTDLSLLLANFGRD